MPRAEIESAYTPAHEKKSGFHEHELEDGMHTLKHAHRIVKNKKYLEEIRKHAKRRAEENDETMTHMERLAKSGRVSEKAMKKHRAY